MQFSTRKWMRDGVLMLIGLSPLSAFAHPDHVTPLSFSSGLVHPLTGWDHLLGLLTLGVVIAFWCEKSFLRGATIVVSGILLGSLMPLVGWRVPHIETYLIFSLFLTSMAFLSIARIQRSIAFPAIGILALIHGHAHGLEVGSVVHILHLTGFLLSTLVIYAIGWQFGSWISRQAYSQPMLRWVGGVMLLLLTLISVF